MMYKISLKEVDKGPLCGGFNTNYFFKGEPGQVLLRVPRTNPDLLKSIEYEYRTIGFTRGGGRVRRRNPHEQYYFSQKAALEGLMVLPPIEHNRNTVVYPFLPAAQTLDAYLKTHKEKMGTVVFSIIDDLYIAHEKGFVYGDRWAGNILVDPQLGIFNIDFDLEISGDYARELDVAQVAYHTLWSGKEEALPFLATCLGSQRGWFRFGVVSNFVRGLSHFLRETRVGGIEGLAEDFISATEAIRQNKKISD